jgi:hypothetical protein
MEIHLEDLFLYYNVYYAMHGWKDPCDMEASKGGL